MFGKRTTYSLSEGGGAIKNFCDDISQLILSLLHPSIPLSVTVVHSLPFPLLSLPVISAILLYQIVPVDLLPKYLV